MRLAAGQELPFRVSCLEHNRAESARNPDPPVTGTALALIHSGFVGYSLGRDSIAMSIVPENVSHDRAGKDYVQVSTCHDPLDDTVTLATIRRFVAKHGDDGAAEAMFIKTIVLLQPMTPDAAFGLAKRYAERKHIPVVYLD
jgi:hypothetical protein